MKLKYKFVLHLKYTFIILINNYFFQFLPYQTGDEDILLSDVVISTNFNTINTSSSNKRLINITDIRGGAVESKKNTPLIYIYDNGTVEKKIIID